LDKKTLLWQLISQAAFEGSAALPDFSHLTFFQAFYLRKIKSPFTAKT
jgi:hypothetical protein